MTQGFLHRFDICPVYLEHNYTAYLFNFRHKFSVQGLKLSLYFCFLQIVDLILAIMAGILHLSNIDFAPDPELQQLIIVNETEVDYGTVR